MQQLDLFSHSDFSQAMTNNKSFEKVTHHTNITASVLTALVQAGMFQDYESIDLDNVVLDYAHNIGVELPHLAGEDEEREYDCKLGELRNELEDAYDKLKKAMDDAHNNSTWMGYCSADEYLDLIYYYYGINSVVAKEQTLPYRDFIKACDGFVTCYQYNY